MSDLSPRPMADDNVERTKPAPLVAPTIALLAGIGLSDALGRVGAGFVAAAFTLCLGLLFVAVAVPPTARRWGFSALLIGALAGGFVRHQWSLLVPANDVSRWSTQDGQLTRVGGRIISSVTVRTVPLRNPWLPMDERPRTQFLLDLDDVRPDGVPLPAHGVVRVTISGELRDARFGSRVALLGRIFQFGGVRNPGESDWRRIFQRQGIAAGLSVESPELVTFEDGAPHGAMTWLLAALRTRARALLMNPGVPVDPDVSALLDAMVLGQRSAVAASLNDAFVRTGAVHLLSVSGFHVGILGTTVWWLVRLVRRGRGTRMAAALTAVVLVLYSLLAEPNAPIFRATIMGVAICLARLTGRSVAPLNWLALAALVIVLLQPNDLFQPGFQLSFVQVAFLIVAFARIERSIVSRWFPILQADVMTWRGLFVRKAARGLLSLLIISLGCWIIAAPLAMFQFQRFAPWAGIDSLVLTPLAAFVTYLGFLTLIAGWIPLVGALVAHALFFASGWLIGLATALSHLPGTLVDTSPPPVWLVVGTFSAAGAWLSLRTPSRPDWRARLQPNAWRAWARPALLTVVGAAWALWIVLPAHSPPPVPTLHVLSVGNGSTALFVTPEGQAAAFDVGTNRNLDAGEILATAARAAGARRFDWITLSHADYDHFSGALTALDDLPVAKLGLTPQFSREMRTDDSLKRLYDGLALRNRATLVLHAGDTISVGSVGPVEVLWPPADLDLKSSDNDSSLVLRLRVGSHSAIIPGDIEQRAMLGLLAERDAGRIDLHAEVLVAPHHGSVRPKATERFLAAVAPHWIIASTAQPRPALEKLVKRVLPEATILETGRRGAVAVQFGNELSVRPLTAENAADLTHDAVESERDSSGGG